MDIKYFVGRYKNDNINSKSSSGGAFTAIIENWFNIHKEDAVCYGCILDEKLRAIHFRSETVNDCDKMRGSKYIQSDMQLQYNRLSLDLKQNKYVLFSGTPCQIAAVNRFLTQKGLTCNEHLLTVEVLCHGVGSAKFFEDYIHQLEVQNKGNAIYCNFRAKKHPGKKQDMEVRFDNGRSYIAASTKYDWFYSVYHKNLILRPSCYKCIYAAEKRIADITIADYWGDSAQAMSVFFGNSEIGIQWVNRILSVMQAVEAEYQSICQPQMLHPAECPNDYDVFWKTYLSRGYMAAQKFVGNNTFTGKIRYGLIRIITNLGISESMKKTIRGMHNFAQRSK